MAFGTRRVVIALAGGLVCLSTLRCGSSGPVGPTPSAPAPPGPPGPVLPPTPGLPQVFVGAGDIAFCDNSSAITARLADAAGGTVFTLGDNAYPSGTREEFRDCYEPTWGRLKARTRPSPGNHDYGSPNAQPYFEYFGSNAGTFGWGYYSFPLGSWHAVSLNSNVAVDAASPQAAWLRSDLASDVSSCTLAYWHHPLFTSGPNGDNPRMRDIWRILYEAGADIVLSAHDHLYERFGSQDPDGRPDPARGIRQFIVGTGGAPLYQFVTLRQNSEVRISTFGVLKLTLTAGAYQWEFISASGTADSGAGTCH
jgi:acid phosphatase type 7